MRVDHALCKRCRLGYPMQDAKGADCGSSMNAAKDAAFDPLRNGRWLVLSRP